MTINIFCGGCQCSFLSSIAEAFTNSVAGSEREWKVKSCELKEVQPTWPIVICKQTNRFMIYSKKYYFRF